MSEKRNFLRKSGCLWMAVALLCLLLLPAAAEDAGGINTTMLIPASRRRALLLGFDRFVTQPNTAPASWNNVDGMAEVLGSMVDLDALWTRRDDISDHAQLYRLIRAAFAGAREGDISYFYISTHGLYQKGQQAAEMGMLLTDGEKDTILTAGQLRESLDTIPGKKMLIIDCCHAGAMIGRGVAESVGNAFAGGDYQVLCSSGGAEDSWFWAGTEGQSTGAGFFTGALIRGISGLGGYAADGNRDGEVTFMEARDYLRGHHGASTVHLYPSGSQETLVLYDPGARQQRGAVSDLANVTFEEGMLTSANPVIHFSFTVVRPVRVGYQLVYQRRGKWDFDGSSIQWDNAEQYGAFGDAMGYLTPGYKEREVSLTTPAKGDFGYVLLQIYTYRNSQPALISSRVFGVTPEDANPQLEVHLQPQYDLTAGEMPIFIGHIYPCELSVTVEDALQRPVRRLVRLMPSRPENMLPMGTSLTFNGLDDGGRELPEGTYHLRITAHINGKAYEKVSADFFLKQRAIPQG